MSGTETAATPPPIKEPSGPPKPKKISPLSVYANISSDNEILGICCRRFKRRTKNNHDLTKKNLFGSNLVLEKEPLTTRGHHSPRKKTSRVKKKRGEIIREVVKELVQQTILQSLYEDGDQLVPNLDSPARKERDLMDRFCSENNLDCKEYANIEDIFKVRILDPDSGSLSPSRRWQRRRSITSEEEMEEEEGEQDGQRDEVFEFEEQESFHYKKKISKIFLHHQVPSKRRRKTDPDKPRGWRKREYAIRKEWHRHQTGIPKECGNKQEEPTLKERKFEVPPKKPDTLITREKIYHEKRKASDSGYLMVKKHEVLPFSSRSPKKFEGGSSDVEMIDVEEEHPAKMTAPKSEQLGETLSIRPEDNLEVQIVTKIQLDEVPENGTSINGPYKAKATPIQMVHPQVNPQGRRWLGDPVLPRMMDPSGEAWMYYRAAGLDESILRNLLLTPEPSPDGLDALGPDYKQDPKHVRNILGSTPSACKLNDDIRASLDSMSCNDSPFLNRNPYFDFPLDKDFESNLQWLDDPKMVAKKIHELKEEIVYLNSLMKQKEREKMTIVCFRNYKETLLRRLEPYPETPGRKPDLEMRREPAVECPPSCPNPPSQNCYKEGCYSRSGPDVCCKCCPDSGRQSSRYPPPYTSDMYRKRGPEDLSQSSKSFDPKSTNIRIQKNENWSKETLKRTYVPSPPQKTDVKSLPPKDPKSQPIKPNVVQPWVDKPSSETTPKFYPNPYMWGYPPLEDHRKPRDPGEKKARPEYPLKTECPSVETTTLPPSTGFCPQSDCMECSLMGYQGPGRPQQPGGRWPPPLNLASKHSAFNVVKARSPRDPPGPP